MKKTVVALGVISASVAVWWGLSYSSSDYRTVPSHTVFSNVTIATPDVRRLADFYKATFDAREVDEPSWSPAGASANSVVLRTPGYGGRGPTLTLIPAAQQANPPPRASDNGYAHLCFESDDMRAVVSRLVAAGGSLSSVFDANDRAPVLYAKDPDGNAVEVHIPLPSPITPRTIYRTLEALVYTRLEWGGPAEEHLRFLHANHNSLDWEQVVAFYRKVFGVDAIGAERDYDGAFIAELTGIRGVAVRGRHIEMPGYSAGGPTVEAFTYNLPSGRRALTFSDAGVVAIGFVTDDLDAMLARVSSAGGKLVFRDGGDAVTQDLYGNLIQFRKAAQGER